MDWQAIGAALAAARRHLAANPDERIVDDSVARARLGSGLATVLEGLAETVGDSVRTRRTIEADRAKPRSPARWVTLITLIALGLLVINGSYVQPYGSALGQLVLLLLLGCYLGCLMWMRNIAKHRPLPRFLGAGVAEREKVA